MSTKLKILAKWLTMSFIGFFVFFITLNLMMDWDVVISKVEKLLTKQTGYEVKIGTMGLKGFSGLKMSDVTMVKAPEKQGQKPTKIFINNLEIESGVFSLLSDDKEIKFSVDMLGGNINGNFTFSGNKKEYVLNWTELKLNKLPGMNSIITLPLKGRLSGNGKLIVPKEGMRKANGNVYITCESCVIGDGKHKVSAKFIRTPRRNKTSEKWAKEGFTLPPLNLGQFNGTINIKKGKATFEDFVAASKDGDLELFGDIRFNNSLKLSTANMYFKFRFSQKSKEKHSTLEGIEISLIRGKRKDGYLGMSVTGRLFSLRFRPSKRGIPDYGKTSKKFKKKKSRKYMRTSKKVFMKPLRFQKHRNKIKRPKIVPPSNPINDY